MLASGRDLAIVLLALEAFVVCGAVGAALYFAIKGLRWLDAQLRLWLSRIRRGVERAEEVTAKVCAVIVKPFVKLDSLTNRVSKAVDSMVSALSASE